MGVSGAGDCAAPVTHAVAALAHFMPFDLDANPLHNIFDNAFSELLLQIAYLLWTRVRGLLGTSLKRVQ